MIMALKAWEREGPTRYRKNSERLTIVLAINYEESIVVSHTLIPYEFSDRFLIPSIDTSLLLHGRRCIRLLDSLLFLDVHVDKLAMSNNITINLSKSCPQSEGTITLMREQLLRLIKKILLSCPIRKRHIFSSY